MEKLSGQTMDLVQHNIDNLKQLFPEVVTEGKIDFEKLKLVLGENIEINNEKYAFTWNGKSDAIKLAQTPSLGTLRPDKESSKNWDETENLYIEGDNLEVLKLLQKSYFGNIKMIYIDPPYNTGKDFVYKDNFRNSIQNYREQTEQTTKANVETSGRYHTDWLNMIYPRLKLARNLLKEDGVIFISIDNKEFTNLKKVCDEIYGEENFIECIIWNKRVPKNDNFIGNIHEYILVYTKSSVKGLKFTMLKEGLEKVEELITKFKQLSTPVKDAEKELRKLYSDYRYDRAVTLYNSMDENYRVWGKINLSWPNGNTLGPTYEILHPKTKKPVKVPERGWRWIEESFKGYLDYSNVIELHDGSFICGKIWFDKDEKTQPSLVKYLDEVDTMLLRSILSYKSDGGIELENLLGNKNVFAYPKPITMLETLFNSIELEDEDIILDFFSGAASTAHGVMRLNSKDNKKRKYILVQLPEMLNNETHINNSELEYKTICDIGKERIRRAGNMVLKESKKSDLDIGFKVFRLESSNIKQWGSEETLEDLLSSLESNIVLGRTNEDLLYEILLKIGLPLTAPIEVIDIKGKIVYDVAFGSVLLCLDDNITIDVVNEMLTYVSEDIEAKVIFKEIGFRDDTAKTNAIQTLKKYGIKEENIRSV